MNENNFLPFRYPSLEEDRYLQHFSGAFSSVFVATNTFLNIPEYELNASENWIPPEVIELAKRRGTSAGLSWEDIADLCGFPSIAHVNRALRLTGSKRIAKEDACPSDTEQLLKVCKENHIFLPDEGYFSPLVELQLARFFFDLGFSSVTVADHFGTSPRQMQTEEFKSFDAGVPPEICSEDHSIYVVIYTDLHYFLVCQTEQNKLIANPQNYFEGFFADENTSDKWGTSEA